MTDDRRRVFSPYSSNVLGKVWFGVCFETRPTVMVGQVVALSIARRFSVFLAYFFSGFVSWSLLRFAG